MTKVFFISGIDTEIGKTYVTGTLLRALIAKNISASSFKLVQTGGQEGQISEDILVHRQLSSVKPTALDINGESVGMQFSLPASPHLAAAVEKASIDTTFLAHRLSDYIEKIQAEMVFCEGAGGIFVPLNTSELTIDFIQKEQLSLILVTSAKLGSLSQTIACLEALAARQYLPVALIYNPYPQQEKAILQDSEQFLRTYCKQHYPAVKCLSLYECQNGTSLYKWFSEI
ncbi:dethiobiotin synthase [Suttonella ornithocola]|uniref:ATP-dependent dethiobiotin synthetase BioD n=1 Tax=Suttonella ornithocola TaxID=279832 RepID=A0A380MLH5_9GAMM|nr:dethiobiotin synthase [Suttonella ornithocola]SUO93098.1 ATP-dependent dethiobiotin synthetase BioD 1 [Suttonella ornithocola]